MGRPTERRRASRVYFSGLEKTPAVEVELPSTASVEFLDIGLGGVLLGDGPELAVGQRGVLKALIGGEALRVLVEIRHRGKRRREGTERMCAGAQFVDLGEGGRDLLQRVFGGG